jgi:hypothetical protein
MMSSNHPGKNLFYTFPQHIYFTQIHTFNVTNKNMNSASECTPGESQFLAIDLFFINSYNLTQQSFNLKRMDCHVTSLSSHDFYNADSQPFNEIYTWLIIERHKHTCKQKHTTGLAVHLSAWCNNKRHT